MGWLERKDCFGQMVASLWNNREDKQMRLLVAVALCLYLLPIWGLAATKQQQHKQRLRFGKDGGFKILQVADMHYANGRATTCLDVFDSQLPTCSDLNTTAFIERMILAEKPHLIVFTGIFISSVSGCSGSFPSCTNLARSCFISSLIACLF